MDDPKVSISKENGKLQYTCQSNGFPEPDIKWTRQPRPAKLLYQRGNDSRKRKLRFWDYSILSNSSHLIFESSADLRKSKDRILICTAKNMASSKSILIQKTQKMNTKDRKNLNLWL